MLSPILTTVENNSQFFGNRNLAGSYKYVRKSDRRKQPSFFSAFKAEDVGLHLRLLQNWRHIMGAFNATAEEGRSGSVPNQRASEQ